MTKYCFSKRACNNFKNISFTSNCHTRAPSWILSNAENLASSILQVGATNAARTNHPPDHKLIWKSIFDSPQCGKSGFFNVVRCPHPQSFPPSTKYVRCPPSNQTIFFLCVVSRPKISLPSPHSDSKQSINLADLVYPSVSLLAELVCNFS